MNNSSVKLRYLTMADYQVLQEAMLQAYKGSGLEIWSEAVLEKLINKFPKGQLCIEVNGKPVAAALSIIVDYDSFGDDHTFHEITSGFTMDTHKDSGDMLYGIEVFVHPEHRGLRLGRRLYDGRKELCESLNLKGIVVGGRIPNFENHGDSDTPKQYIKKVQQRELYDPVLSFQLSNGFQIKKVLENYMPGDRESREYATLLQWNNIYFENKRKLINQKKSVVRLGLVQWQMRRANGLDDIIEQAEFFADSVSRYQADFLVYPEFFNAPLMAAFNDQDEAQSIRSLERFTQPLLEKFKEFAITYNINIVTGSMPLLEGSKLYNVSYLCQRNGQVGEQRKIHITPGEIESWGMVGGNKLEVFETDAGRVAILICYDVEFPELSRILAEKRVQILLVPFLTDTQNGYHRVRHCAQARAIENECYVAIAGCVGNLPKVQNMDIQYAQSAVFSPSDFQFPTDAIIAQATPNTEMMLIADVNLISLKELHEVGSVRNLKDRRLDLYSVICHPDKY